MEHLPKLISWLVVLSSQPGLVRPQSVMEVTDRKFGGPFRRAGMSPERRTAAAKGGRMWHTDTWCSRWQLCGQMDLFTCAHTHTHTHTCTLTHKHILCTYSQLLPLCLHTLFFTLPSDYNICTSKHKEDVYMTKQKMLHWREYVV